MAALGRAVALAQPHGVAVGVGEDLHLHVAGPGQVALEVALDGAGEAGAATSLLDLRELNLPMYNPDDEREPPAAASTLIDACYAADGMLWRSPMDQGTISGAVTLAARASRRSCTTRSSA